MASDSKKAVAKTAQGGAVVPHDYGTDAGSGFENQTGDDIVLPFLGVLQGLSPQVAKKIGDGGLEGAKVGMLHNSVTDELFDGDSGLEFIPAVTEHVFVEWVPRAQGGGFVGVHAAESQVVKDAKAGATKFGKFSTAYAEDGARTGNDLVETFYVYGLLVTDEGNQPCAIAFTSTKISVYKRWNTKVQMFCKDRIPLFANRVKIATVGQSHADGDSFNFALSPFEGDMASSLLPPDDERFLQAKDVRELIASGAARVNHEGTQATGTTDGEDPPF